MFIPVTTGWPSLWLTGEIRIHHLTMIAFVSQKPSPEIVSLPCGWISETHAGEYLNSSMKREPAVHSDFPLLGGITSTKRNGKVLHPLYKLLTKCFYLKYFPLLLSPPSHFILYIFLLFIFFNILYCFI